MIYIYLKRKRNLLFARQVQAVFHHLLTTTVIPMHLYRQILSLLCKIHLFFFFLQGVAELGMNIGHAPEVMGFMANMPHAPSVAPINMRIGFAPAVAGFQVANAGQKL